MSRTKPSRSLVVNLVLVLAAFGLLGIAIASNREKLAEVFARPIDWRAYALGFAFNITSLTLTFFRWHWLVTTLGIPFRLVDAFRVGFVGNVFNLVIPGAVGGDVIKAVFLARARPDRKAAAAASMVIDRLLGLAGLFLLASLAGIAAFSRAGSEARVLIGLTWAALAVGTVGLAALFTPRFYPLLNRLVAGKPKPAQILRDLEAAAVSFRSNLGVVFGCLFISVGVHGLNVLAFYSASRAIFDSVPSLAEHFLMVPLVLFTTAVPLPFGALGLSENASGLMFRMVGHPNGAVAMMAFRVLMYVGGLISSIVYALNLKQIRDLTRAAEAEVAADA